MMSDLVPDGYAATLEDLKKHVHAARLEAQRKVNNELLQLWWRIGRTILDRQAEEGWGTKVLGRLAADLRGEFPSMKGFSRANLFYMRSFAEAWPDEDSIVQRPVGQLPWGHVIELLDKLDNQELRDWYAAKDAHHGWSRPLLQHQIITRLHEREAAAPSNFAGALDRLDSEQAQEITKDPYALQFLAVDSSTSERELEQRMLDRILDTMRELGPGLAFVGRQVHFDVDGDDFFVDLLFFHVEQLRYGTTAHKQGRVAGENAIGGDTRFAGSLGTQVVKVFDVVAARTGLRDHEATAAGFAPHSHTAIADDHKRYYPGATPISIRITGDNNDGRLLGAQLVGTRGAEISKRVDTYATSLHHGMTVAAMSDLDLSYTPPLGSPWDAVQVATQAWEREMRSVLPAV